MLKVCRVCGIEKSLLDYYPSKTMLDGLDSKCKACKIARIKQIRASKREYYSKYEQKRNKRPERRKKQLAKDKRCRQNNKHKFQARKKLWTEIIAGRVVRMPCQICGDHRVEAHHHDYSKPLDVQWFCFRHHREVGHGQSPIVHHIDRKKKHTAPVN